MPRIRATADPSVRENKKEASSHLQGGETIVVREGNRKDVPSEMRNRFVRSFVCLFVCGVALRASTKLWRGVRGVFIYLCSGAYKVIYCFWAIFRPRGGVGKPNKKEEKFLVVFLRKILGLFVFSVTCRFIKKNIFDNSDERIFAIAYFFVHPSRSSQFKRTRKALIIIRNALIKCRSETSERRRTTTRTTILARYVPYQSRRRIWFLSSRRIIITRRGKTRKWYVSCFLMFFPNVSI